MPGVVSALCERVTASTTALDTGKIADLHRSCVNMTGLAAAIPSRTGSLSADAKAKASTAASHLRQQVVVRYSSAGSGNTAAGKAALVAITADIDAVGALVRADR